MYTGFIGQLSNVHKAENSDNLYVATVLQENVVVDSTYYDGQLVFYFPADGCLDYDFAMKFGLMREDKDGNKLTGYLDYPSCHIRAIKLRGNRSEGIVIDVQRVKDAYNIDDEYEVGDRITHIAGHEVCKKYIPKKGNTTREGGLKTSMKGRKARGIRVPEFDMHADTEQLDFNLNQLHPGDMLHMTLKMHGTSQRSMRTYAEIERYGIMKFFEKIFHLKPKVKPVYVCGTRRTLISDYANGGFYGNDMFRKQHHDRIEPYVKMGMEVFYEVVGYYGPGETDTIMPIGDNTVLRDKQFVKEFGKQSKFVYGCKPGESEMYVYRIVQDGREFTPVQISEWCRIAGVKCVPHIAYMTYTTPEALLTAIDNYFRDLHDPIGKDHIKEGVVVRIFNRPTWKAYKKKTMEFKIIEGIVKLIADAPDMEEAQDL